MKAKVIGYWLATALVAFAMGVGGAFDVLSPPDVVELLKHLGYAAYVGPLIGTWKVLAALTILAPGLPLIKEWAYAGIVFDLTGAAVSHAAVGDSADKVVIPLVLVGLTAASWALRPPSRRLERRASGEPAASPARDLPRAA